MRELILRLIINTVSLYAAGSLISGLHVETWQAAIIGAIIFSILNMIVKPIIKLISLPITIMTLGLFTLVINAAILGLTAFLTDISIDGFGAAFWGAMAISFINWALGVAFIGKKKKR